MRRSILTLVLIIIGCTAFVSCSQTSSQNVGSEESLTAVADNMEINNDDNLDKIDNLTYNGKAIKDIEAFSNGYKIDVSPNSLASLLSAENEKNEIAKIDSYTVFAKIVLINEDDEKIDYGEIISHDGEYAFRLNNNKFYKLDNLEMNN